MTTEQKAKRYDEALERARRIKNGEDNWRYSDLIEIIPALEEVLPELRESEDEKIREALIDGVRQIRCKNGVTQEQMLAYLEKQKECVADSSKTSADEDESIRKFLVDYFASYKIGNVTAKLNGVRIDDILNYLERQKEQKPAEKQDYSGLSNLERVIHRGFLAAGLEDVPVTIIKETAKECVAQMKPAEWDEYTKTNLDMAIRIIKHARGNLYGYQTDDGIYECNKTIECLEHFLYRGLEIEKPAEWSEEDEKVYEYLKHGFEYATNNPNLLCSSLWGGSDATIQDYKNFVDKLKFLRPQSKQEWSEEDEMLMDELESYILYDKQFNDEQKSWRIKRLKSLRPSWKPSEEQMEALNVLNCHGGLSYVGQQNQLISLYNDLKKLM